MMWLEWLFAEPERGAVRTKVTGSAVRTLPSAEACKYVCVRTLQEGEGGWRCSVKTGAILHWQTLYKVQGPIACMERSWSQQSNEILPVCLNLEGGGTVGEEKGTIQTSTPCVFCEEYSKYGSSIQNQCSKANSTPEAQLKPSLHSCGL